MSIKHSGSKGDAAFIKQREIDVEAIVRLFNIKPELLIGITPTQPKYGPLMDLLQTELDRLDCQFANGSGLTLIDLQRTTRIPKP